MGLAGLVVPEEQLFPSALRVCSAPPARDAIVAYADGYTAIQLGILIHSIRRVMHAANVDIVLFSNVNESAPQPTTRGGSVASAAFPTVGDFTRHYAVQLLPFIPPRVAYNRSWPLLRDFGVYRFFLYAALAQTRCHRGLIFIDARDVYFQRDVFAAAPSDWWEDGMVVSFEGKGSAFIDAPRKPNIRMIECLYGASALVGFPICNASRPAVECAQTMACTGVLAGGGRSLRRFLGAYTRSVASIGHRSCHRWIPDQVALNYMVHHPAQRAALEAAGVRLVLSTHESGPFMHTDWQSIRARGDVPWTVRNDAGTIASLVHGFDRSPELVRGAVARLANETSGLPKPYIRSNGVGGWGR